MGREYRDKEWLKEKYVEENHTLQEIADMCDVHNATIHDWVGRHDLPRRSRSESLRRNYGTHEGKYNDPEWLHEEYVVNERSAIDIADECGVHHDTIYKRLNEHGIDRRTVKEATNVSDDMGFEGRGHPAWKEYAPFRTHHRDSYEYWSARNGEEQHQVYVHRLLAVAEHGLDALDGKIVHHENGIKWDNRPDNLELMEFSDHVSLHHERGDYPQSS